ncbi:MAG TPA: LytTR family DNA-binding domain-containing protein [Chitinophagaceae bacterium]|nr:LytTR family DNA-binding domain-containing protein [Chitinophagaceae bacterium]
MPVYFFGHQYLPGFGSRLQPLGKVNRVTNNGVIQSLKRAPVDSYDLREAVNKAERQMKQGGIINHQATTLIDNNRLPPEQQKVALPGKEGYDFIPVADIIYCQASGSYTHLVLKNNQRLLVSKPLGEIETLLPSSLFERIHHSSIINLTTVSQYRRTNGTYVVMLNGDELVVSRSKKDRLMQLLGIN